MANIPDNVIQDATRLKYQNDEPYPAKDTLWGKKKNGKYTYNIFNEGEWHEVARSGGAVPPVTSVNGKTGDVVLDANDVGALPNTTPIPAAQVNADWNANSGVAQILNKPTIPDTTDCIKKSSTAGLVKNDGTIDTNIYLTQHQDISGKEDKSNKVTSWQSTPDDTHYPSEKLVKDSVDAVDNVYVADSSTYDRLAVTAALNAGKAVFLKYNDAVYVYDHSDAKDSHHFYKWYENGGATGYYKAFNTPDANTILTQSTNMQKDRLVTAWGSTPSDIKYPSEKLVKDRIDVLPKYRDDVKQTGSPTCDGEAETIGSTTVYPSTTTYTVKPNQKITLEDSVGTNTLYLIDATDSSNKAILSQAKSKLIWNNIGDANVVIEVAASASTGQTLSVSVADRGVDKVFEAKYGVTTYRQIVDANNAGCIVFLYIQQIKYFLSKVEGYGVIFSYFDAHNKQASYIVCSNSNVWTSQGGYFESSSNRATDFSTINNTKYPSTKAVADYAEKLTDIVAPVNATDATLPITTLTCEVGKYYRIDVAVDTLAVTLPAMTDLTTVRTVVIHLTAGTTPAVTITSADSKNVYYQDGFEIEVGNTYEINALFNGAAWIVAAVEINVE